MKNILLKLQFVGTRYAGWQRQKNAVTIQQLIEEALMQITGTPHVVTGCSRTDAGVHAEEFIANFLTDSTIPAARFASALQSKLPEDILVTASREVALDFNARRKSYEKTYRYQIFLGRSPFCNDRWWQLGDDPDLETLLRCAALIAGTHDFSGFCVLRSRKADNRCAIKQAAWRRSGRRLYFQITGDRFLHHMVRFLVGAQIEVALGKLTPEQFRQIIEHPESRRAKFPAPPDGLYLERVKFR